MALNYHLVVSRANDPDNHCDVVVNTMQKAMYLAGACLSKWNGNGYVTLGRTTATPTHANSYAAEAFIDVTMFKLE